VSWPEAFYSAVTALVPLGVIVGIFGPDIIRAWRDRNDKGGDK
jgi:hypothetical protein